MSQQPPPDQQLNIDNASIEGSQIGQAGRDLIQGQVVNVTVYDSIDVAGLLGRQTFSLTKPLTQQEYRNRKVLLNKVKKFWIEDVLEKSLHVRALIELGLEEQLDAVERPFSGVQEVPEETRKTLPTGTGITQVFNQMGEGRTLLILGEPGAGKTTTLLKLAQNLIARTEADVNLLISVVFHLSSWKGERQTIADWLVQELNSKYQVSPDLGKAWVKEQQLLLLLDGLDEVKAERREACVQALNQFMQAHGQTEIVVCSRIRDYEALSTRLQLQGAICIQSLTSEQVSQYLEQAGEQLEAVKTLLQEDIPLRELAKSPLTLSIMSLAYQGISAEELPRTGSVEERRQHLFNAYIKRMFLQEKTGKPRGYKPPYSSALTVRWLTWLAQRIRQESQTIFLIERMQPTWLQNQAQRRLYRFGNGLTIGLIVGLPIGLYVVGVVGLGSGLLLILGLSLALIAGLANGLFFWQYLGLRAEIETAETLRFSWKEATSALIFGLISGPILSLIMGLSFWMSSGLTSELILALVGGLILALVGGLRNAPVMENKTFPNQGIRRSFVNAGIVGLISGLILALVGGLIVELRLGLISGLILALVGGLTVGLNSKGGQACLQHFTLRVILYRNGFIPWNYARFLDYATERIFLQKVGGGYIFVHRLLLEHFAQLKVEN